MDIITKLPKTVRVFDSVWVIIECMTETTILSLFRELFNQEIVRHLYFGGGFSP